MVIIMFTLNQFYLFSIIGFFFETILFAVLNLHNQSGFLYLCWTPFYGTGVVLIEAIHRFMVQKVPNHKKRNLYLFFLYFIVLTLLEWIGGVLLEWMHGYRLWNYEMVPLHIGKYVSIPTSLVWTTFAFLYLYGIKKLTDPLIKKIPKGMTIVFSILFLLDFLFTLRKLFIIQVS